MPQGIISTWKQAAPIVRTTIHGALEYIVMNGDVECAWKGAGKGGGGGEESPPGLVPSICSWAAIGADRLRLFGGTMIGATPLPPTRKTTPRCHAARQ